MILSGCDSRFERKQAGDVESQQKLREREIPIVILERIET